MAKSGFLLTLLTLAGCSATPGDQPNSDAVTYETTYAAKPANLRVHLTDAPARDVSEVHVNIRHIELMLASGGKSARLRIANGLGDVDLLTLRNGVLLPLQDVSIPASVTIKGIRIVLEDQGHYVIHGDGRRCDLQTPSAQQSGLKVIMKNPVTFESEKSYSLVIDFDAQKSLVFKGNGDCLLKPVLRLPSFTVTDQDDVPAEGGEPDSRDGEDQLCDGSDESPPPSGDEGSITSDDPAPVVDEGIDEMLVDPDDLPLWFLL